MLKGPTIFMSASIDTLIDRILSKKHKNSKTDTLTAAQSRMLFLLWNNDNIPIKEVSRITHLKKSTLTSTLKKLEKAGHIKLTPSDKDKRGILVQIVNKNEYLVALNKKFIDETADIFYKGFTEKETELYESFLNRTLKNLIEYENKL
ncbi:MarR family winged helix-turn-helix transcriptional regulator [Lacrimispora sp. 38-1]|uniref:MarR family winged helix-turn-helix transcriptional regulator n=1 Tax=Lacrimispora sp. 38-1 TaxID=3125778 RepID=UPI003CF6E608